MQTKKYIVGVIVGALLMPTVSFAQVTDPVQRAAILQLIASLVEQVKILQAQLAELKEQEADQAFVRQLREETRLQEEAEQQRQERIGVIRAEIQDLGGEGIYTCSGKAPCTNMHRRVNELYKELNELGGGSGMFLWWNGSYWEVIGG